MALIAPCSSAVGFGDLRSSICKLRGVVYGGPKGKMFMAARPRRITVYARSAGGQKSFINRASRGGSSFSRLDSCLVIPPASGQKPQAVIMFLGGAFIGAVPEVTYSYLLDLLSKEGFLIVSVPYSVTFDHSRVSREVYEKFHACLERLSTSGVPESRLCAADIANLPLYSVGHSNGALLQAMIGSYFSEKIPKANVIVFERENLNANVIISFNNKPASVAVPYFEQVGPLVNQSIPIVKASPLFTPASNASGDVWKTFTGTASTLLQQYNLEAATSFNNFVDQLPSVVNEVAQGTSEFKPTPSENRDLFRKAYNVPHTLLVKFDTDGIDETDALEEVLRSRVESTGGSLGKISLPGNHLTPCIQDVRWRVSRMGYGPADAVAQGLKSLFLNDSRALATTITNWLDQIKSKTRRGSLSAHALLWQEREGHALLPALDSHAGERGEQALSCSSLACRREGNGERERVGSLADEEEGERILSREVLVLMKI